MEGVSLGCLGNNSDTKSRALLVTDDVTAQESAHSGIARLYLSTDGSKETHDSMNGNGHLPKSVLNSFCRKFRATHGATEA